MTPLLRGQTGNVAVAVLLALCAVVLISPLVLHFTQQRHNQLPFAVERQYPPGKQFVSGEIFASTVIALMDRELSGGTGWRPNDIVLWGPAVLADNNANRQLGIIQAVRESVRVLRDHLTKVSATEYDENLRDADTKFRNDETKFWFPSAESKFREANQALQRYVNGLHTTPPSSKPINRRNVELIRLFQAWTDLLGGAHADLYKEDVSFWQTDDFFYRAQGYTHVMYHLIVALRKEFAGELESRPTVVELFDEVTDSLRRAALSKPLVVLDAGPDGIFANHRRNLDVFIVEARQKMYSIREELEK